MIYLTRSGFFPAVGLAPSQLVFCTESLGGAGACEELCDVACPELSSEDFQGVTEADLMLFGQPQVAPQGSG